MSLRIPSSISDEMMNANTRRIEKTRHVYRMIFSAVLILMEAALFFAVWKYYYNPHLRVPYHFKGNYFVSFIYGLLLLVFGNLYGGLKLGYYRTFHIIFSLAVSALVSNAVAYFTIIIPAATWYLSPVPAVVVLTGLQLLVVIVWSVFGNRLFLRLFPAQRLVLLYGSRTDELAAKFATRTDRYKIEEKLCVEGENAFAPKTFSEVCSEICRYDGVIIGDISAELRNDYLKFCYSHFIRTYTVPKLTDIILKSGETLHIFDSPMYLNRNYGLSIGQEFVKRCMDIAVSLIGLVLCSPILLLTALAIRLEDGGPVFFRQERCTQGGRVFSILKFRSMIVDAEKDGRVIPATERDPRITKVGRVIRATRIDELPQLLNILKGDMAIVGPRPERVEHVRQYSADIPEFSYRMLVKGGLTGYAQVYGKYNTTAYDKLKLDLMYIQNYSLILDLEIMFKTLQIVLTKESTEGFSEGASEEIGEKAEEKR